MTKPPLPQSGGSYVVTEDGALAAAKPQKPPKAAKTPGDGAKKEA